jgi:hypothetical protein
MSAIERLASGRSAEDILAEWRSAERARDDWVPGSREWLRADQLVDALRHEFHEAVGSLTEKMEQSA